ncbi:MAG: hypothetical protein J4G01_08470, partial [Dehalococcoidia bacterium]|nr:hypothetical protein [Dehalococcoidia bacterium]
SGVKCEIGAGMRVGESVGAAKELGVGSVASVGFAGTGVALGGAVACSTLQAARTITTTKHKRMTSDFGPTPKSPAEHSLMDTIL